MLLPCRNSQQNWLPYKTIKGEIIMKNLTNKISTFAGQKGQLLLVILSIALFVLAAGAPNSTIGIGR